MTLTDHERPRATTKPKLSPAPAVRPSASPLYVPPMPEARPRFRATMLGAAALGLLGVVVIAPWDGLPTPGAGWRQAFLDVGVPRQYRELLSDQGGSKAEEPPVTEFHEDPSLTALLGKNPAPPPPAVAPGSEPAVAPAAPAPLPAQPKVFMATTAPEPAARAKAAPAAVEKPEHEVAAASPDVISYRVQIAATDTDSEAEALWRRVQRDFPEETSGRSLVVRLAEVKGRVVRRAIITGFPTSDAARAFCARLAAADRGCILRGKG